MLQWPRGSFRPEDLILIVPAVIYVVLCPYTKVEESFNVQATHDILFFGTDLDAYDHHMFPGVVPRTFIGALALSALAAPWVWLSGFVTGGNQDRVWALVLVRCCLALLVCGGLLRLSRAVTEKFGRHTAVALHLITTSQFHLLFYSGRPLPNTFALVLVLCAFAAAVRGGEGWPRSVTYLVAATVIFRCDVAVLLLPMLVVGMLKRVPKVGLSSWFCETLTAGAIAGFSSLALTVGVDSIFWRRWLWPEGEVLFFNTVLNKSHEWGIMPFHWYFTRALPKACLTALPLAAAGAVRVGRVPVGGKLVSMVDWRVVEILGPVITFVGLYSFLPHKELRFIFYAIPVVNVAAAVAAGRAWSYRSKSILPTLLVGGMLAANAAATGAFFLASYDNYPGGIALRDANAAMLSSTSQEPSSCHLHIGVKAAMTGVSRYGELHGISSGAVRYSKAEDLSPGDAFKPFTHLLTEDPDAHRDMFDVMASTSGFSGIRPREVIAGRWPFSSSPQIYLMRKKESQEGTGDPMEAL